MALIDLCLKDPLSEALQESQKPISHSGRVASASDNFLAYEDDGLMLVLVYLTKPGQTISRSALREFCATLLEKDHTFRHEFYYNIVFYGSGKKDLLVEPEAFEELAAWNTKTHTFITGDPATVVPGPYVFSGGRTWQP
ncbi:hypothetical protein EG329_001876 [Mollisiaceae sp. DMI_Dod_QoI]|nr:hypothetical protein EG329_001876 [Helotiales sp. DMI_Dod_QoI]